MTKRRAKADGYFVAGWKGSSQNYCGFDGKMKA
jgi:hypothetical protein